jgi:exodeoxyribonuclease VII small subunit
VSGAGSTERATGVGSTEPASGVGSTEPATGVGSTEPAKSGGAGSAGAGAGESAGAGAGNAERTFEELSRELEEIVARLERGDVGVDDAIALFKRGEELHRACVERLEAAQLRLEELAATDDVARG